MAKKKKNKKHNKKEMAVEETQQNVSESVENSKNETSDKKNEEVKSEKEEVEIQKDKTDVKDKNKEETKEETKKKESKKEETKEERLERELAESKDKYVRLSAEFDNYRKRTLKERMDMLKNASEDVLLGLLKVVDNFERALKTMETAEDVAAVKEGVELIYKDFTGFLDQRGMKPIEAIGKEFNTDEHEAVTKIPAPSDDMKGKVVDVIEKGYKLHDKVSRYSKVVIGE